MPTPAEVAAFVDANKNNPQAIVNAANRYGVTLTDIAADTGYSDRAISIWLGNNGLTARDFPGESAAASATTGGVSGAAVVTQPPATANAADATATAAAAAAAAATSATTVAAGAAGVVEPFKAMAASLWEKHRMLLIGAGLLALLAFSPKKGR